jgi:hypothetical protein
MAPADDAAYASVTRGRFRQVVDAGSRQPVDIVLYGCKVTKAPHTANGKTYVWLDVAECVGDVQRLRDVDVFIKREASPRFSPVTERMVIAKLTRATQYATDDGAAAWKIDAALGDLVDVVLQPGAFGGFGYCMLVNKLKPHATRLVR